MLGVDGYSVLIWLKVWNSARLIRTYSLTYLFNYLFTAWSRVLPKKLTGFQLVK